MTYFFCTFTFFCNRHNLKPGLAKSLYAQLTGGFVECHQGVVQPTFHGQDVIGFIFKRTFHHHR